MNKNLPRTSGVYQILCKSTGKIYIGSAVNLQARWVQHCNKLRRGTHHNIYLQSAWNKYGEENFEFSILEFVSAHDLLSIEQQWIDRSGCTDRAIGFNIFDTAGSPGETFAQVWEGFVDPAGNAVTITNLHKFCRENGLNPTAMRQLALGTTKLKSHKGWTHKNSVRQRDYAKTYDGFIDPAGNFVGPITNLAAFCREHGLDNTHMVAVANGRILSHRGWTFNNGKQRLVPKVYTGFISPEGQRVVITNLPAFCQEHELTEVHMRQLISGVRKSHTGWSWRE